MCFGARVLSTRHERDRLAIGEEHQNSRAGNCNTSRDAMMPSPGPVLVLHLENLGRHIRVPFIPLLPAGAMETVADVQIREKLLSTDRAESCDEARVGKMRFDPGDLRSVLLPIGTGAADLFEFLSVLI